MAADQADRPEPYSRLDLALTAWTERGAEIGPLTYEDFLRAKELVEDWPDDEYEYVAKRFLGK